MLATMDGAVDLARDRELVEACQAGDETAFAELYSRYHRRLLRFCLRRVHAADDAEEAVQEAFTRAWRALPRFGGDRRFYPWLTVIAGNVCTDMLRRRARLVPLEEMPARSADGASEAEVDERLLRQVDLAMATEALGHLSDRHQRVLRLREATEWTSQRIADEEGVAVPAVDTLLWRARQAFKREFAALAESSGLAAALGIGAAAIRRLSGRAGRAGARLASLAALPTRSPGALVATVAITGAAVAGGGVALVGSGHPAAQVPLTRSAQTLSTARDAGSSPGTTASSGLRASGPGLGAAPQASDASDPASGKRAGPDATADGSAAPGATRGPATTSGLAGQVASGSSGASGASAASPLGGLAAAGSNAVQSLGGVVGTGIAAAGGLLGLSGPTSAGLSPPPVPAPGTLGTRSRASGSGAASPVTAASATGAVGTAVSGVTGNVGNLASGATSTLTTAVSTTTRGLLGASE